jgi:hypothetical protein
MPAESVNIPPPGHPLYALTTYELRDYRRELERAITEASPGDPLQADLRGRLGDVLAEQESRAKRTTSATT